MRYWKHPPPPIDRNTKIDVKWLTGYWPETQFMSSWDKQCGRDYRECVMFLVDIMSFYQHSNIHFCHFLNIIAAVILPFHVFFDSPSALTFFEGHILFFPSLNSKLVTSTMNFYQVVYAVPSAEVSCFSWAKEAVRPPPGGRRGLRQPLGEGRRPDGGTFSWHVSLWQAALLPTGLSQSTECQINLTRRCTLIFFLQ